ncbi:MAG: FAD-dependent monooxygenase [Pseudonocardiales bacterium]|nr:FAD-dependent monooxygenase [Pseudonocardiales bacterium]
MRDVIVIGAGPTGLMLAGELALAGAAVEVIERQVVPSGQSRGGGINSRTSEVLAMRGLLDAVIERSIPTKSARGHFAGLPVPLDTRPWRTRHPDGVLIPQDRLEAVLEDHLRGLGVAVRRGTELVGLTCGEAGIEAAVSGPGGQEMIEGRYLVACDGAHSTVRKVTGVAFPGRAGTLAAVSADVELAAVSTTVPRSVSHISRLIRTGGGFWMLTSPLGPAGVYRVVFGSAEQQALARQAPVTADEVARALTAVHGPETKLAKLRWGSRFSDAARQVTNYRYGRVLFAGDAAHIHSPIGGQGLNLGIQDAMNLGWKLAAHVHGRAPAGLLDSYHAERHPVAARVLATTRAQAVLMSPPPEADDLLALREIVTELARLPDANRYLAGLMSGLDLRYDLGGSDATDPLVGTRMIDLSLQTPAGPTTVSALLQPGRGLLLELGDQRAPRLALPPNVTAVTARVVDSPVGTAMGASPGVDRVLVRPDGYVCWVGAGPESSPQAALQRWFGGHNAA